MMNGRRQSDQVRRVVLIGVMAAMAFVSNYLRIPFLDSKITVGNAVCVLNGLLFGPAGGFLASGIGNLLFDLMTGYGAESLITMVSKGAISLVTGAIAGSLIRLPVIDRRAAVRLVLGSLAGAATYVALYMLKTFIFGLTVNGLTLDATFVKMLAKLPASSINAVFATIVTPIFFRALHPAIRHGKLLD